MRKKQSSDPRVLRQYSLRWNFLGNTNMEGDEYVGNT